jgi:hypothetical protein
LTKNIHFVYICSRILGHFQAGGRKGLVLRSSSLKASYFCLLILFFYLISFFDIVFAQWSTPIPISETNAWCEDPDIVTQGNKVFLSYSSFQPFVASFVRSTDCGVSWTNPFLLIDSTVLEGVMPKLEVVGDTLHAIFWGFRNQESHRLFYRRSTNLGQSWDNLRYITEPRGILGYADIAYKTGVNPRLVSIFASTWSWPDSNFIMGVSSLTGGRNWTAPYQLWNNVNDTYDMTLLESRGRLHLIFGLGAVVSLEIAYMHSDDGINWSDPIFLSPVDIYDGQWPRAEVDSTGLLAVSWFDYKYGAGGGGFYGDILMNISTDNGNTWSGERRITNLQSARTSAVAVDSPNVYVAYEDIRDNRNGEIYFRQSSDLGESWSEEERHTNDNARESYGPSLAVSTCNGERTLHLAWTQGMPDSVYKAIFYSNNHLPVSVGDEPVSSLPNRMKITLTYPNPSNGNISIEYYLSYSTYIHIELFDLLGGKVASILTGKQIQGTHVINFNADEWHISSGVYFIKMSAGGVTDVKKVMFLK